MSTRFICAAAVLLLNLLTPAPAAAQFWDVIRWFNDMSGPQMLGFTVEVPVACGFDEGNRSTLFECTQFALVKEVPSGVPRRWTVGLRTGYLANTKLFGDDESVDRSVNAIVLGAGTTTALLRGRPAIQIDALGAVDFVRFGGPSVDDFWVPTLNVGAAFRYGGNRHRSPLVNGLRASIRYQKFFDTFDGTKFNAPGTFESEREGIWQFTVGWILF
jgi:hypothetical protein